jgi:hypothetical protein
MIYKAPFDEMYVVYGTLNELQIYDQNWVMVIYTGDVTYIPELKNKLINEDFDFNKIKNRNNIESD